VLLAPPLTATSGSTGGASPRHGHRPFRWPGCRAQSPQLGQHHRVAHRRREALGLAWSGSQARSQRGIGRSWRRQGERRGCGGGVHT